MIRLTQHCAGNDEVLLAGGSRRPTNRLELDEAILWAAAGGANPAPNFNPFRTEHSWRLVSSGYRQCAGGALFYGGMNLR